MKLVALRSLVASAIVCVSGVGGFIAADKTFAMRHSRSAMDSSSLVFRANLFSSNATVLALVALRKTDIPGARDYLEAALDLEVVGLSKDYVPPTLNPTNVECQLGFIRWYRTKFPRSLTSKVGRPYELVQETLNAMPVLSDDFEKGLGCTWSKM